MNEILGIPKAEAVIPKTNKRLISEVLAPLNEIAANSSSLIAAPSGKLDCGDETCELPRYLFIGPGSGGEPIRVGLFAGIHGDEPEGVYALIRLVELLEAWPEIAAGYCPFIYPICNPTWFEER